MAPRVPRDGQEPRATNLELAVNARAGSFLAHIVREMNATTEKLLKLNPDAKHNAGRMLGEMYLWDEIQKYAAAMSKQSWARAEETALVVTDGLDPGEHTIEESPRFYVKAVVSQKVKRFDPTVLANWFAKSKFKVPLMVTKEQIEHAKVPTKSTVSTTVVER